jgi:MoaA/NifB/PqqE/SkfB family radical SAM enzyme
LIDTLRLLRDPVSAEKRVLLRRRWEGLDARWRVAMQGYGQQSTGCSATIGVQPRCDFDCGGCYLGAEANRLRPLAVAEVLEQLDELRAHLGPKGNVQITDGEVTLLPRADLVRILQHARGIGLIPMLMTHGDSFRRDAELLERLVVDGGLTEVGIHVDTTQRGRLGYKKVRDEAGLMPLRDEFAAMIRDVRRRTGRPLRAAHTLTVTRDNLDGVPAVIDWCLRNRDVFGIVSLQPLAQVGRTRAELRGVRSDELWERIGRALAPYGFRGSGSRAFLFGHPECTRFEPLIVLERTGQRPEVVPVLRPGHPEDEMMVEEFYARGLGGLSFRDDTLPERLCRTAGALMTCLPWLAGPGRRWLAARASELGISLAGLALNMIRGRLRAGAMTIASHHFMSGEEIRTPLGQERLAACVFRLPVEGRMMPMCEVNAAGYRAGVQGGVAGHAGTAVQADIAARAGVEAGGATAAHGGAT